MYKHEQSHATLKALITFMTNKKVNLLKNNNKGKETSILKINRKIKLHVHSHVGVFVNVVVLHEINFLIY